ncbi:MULTISPECIES: hypothetical protein [Bacillus cereus group]|nr:MULTISPECIES: hypothetical protein [Bacillus cereus group]MED3621026.1 hypothetical protein [Bacillus thuringiensis]
MTDKTGSSQAIYISKDVAMMLKIQEPTLDYKKYRFSSSFPTKKTT